eukprot:841466-Pleurochrysis_carterae.AAC.2
MIKVFFRSLPGQPSYAVATEPFAHALPAPSCSSVFSRISAFPLAHALPVPSCSSVFFRISAFPREPDSAFCGGKLRDSFDDSPLLTFRQPIFLSWSDFLLKSVGPLQHISWPVVGSKSLGLVGPAQVRPEPSAARDSSCPFLSASIGLVLVVTLLLVALYLQLLAWLLVATLVQPNRLKIRAFWSRIPHFESLASQKKSKLPQQCWFRRALFNFPPSRLAASSLSPSSSLLKTPGHFYGCFVATFRYQTAAPCKFDLPAAESSSVFPFCLGMPFGTLRADKTEGYKRAAAHLDQRLGHTIRELASLISYLNTLCDQLTNSDFGDTPQGRRLIVGAKLFAKGRRGERSLRHLQRELRYAPTSARQTDTAHPASGGLHLPRAPYRRESLRAFDPRTQCRKLVAVPEPERQFVYPPHVADLQSIVTSLQISLTLQPVSTQHAKALEDAKIAADCSLVRDLLIQ